MMTKKKSSAVAKAATPKCTVKVGRCTSTTDLVAHVTVTFTATKKTRQTFRFTCPVQCVERKGATRG